MSWSQQPSCQHLGSIRDVEPTSEGCAECIAAGDTWVHLRLCLSCGNVGCCDQSKNTHARKHAAASEHPIVRSFEVGETWRYCFPDNQYV